VNDCVKCGTCTTVCPVYQITGREMFTARGRHQLLDNLARSERTAVFEEIFSKCLLCGACRDACPRGLDTPARIIAARAEFSRFTGHSFLQYLARRAIAAPGLLAGLAAAGEALNRLLVPRLPEESGLRLRLTAIDFAGLQPAARGYIEGLAKARTRPGTDAATSYFVGCLANHLQPEIGQAMDSLIKGASGTLPGVPASQTCCGGAAIAAGNLAEGRRLARKNIAAFGNGTTPIVTSCASCFDQLSTYPELLADDAAWQERAVAFAGRLRENIIKFGWEDGTGDFPAAFISAIHELKLNGKVPAYKKGETGYTLGSMKGRDYDGLNRRELTAQAFGLEMLGRRKRHDKETSPDNGHTFLPGPARTGAFHHSYRK